MFGVNVPSGIWVIGFDDIEQADFMIPSLTTIRHPLQHMGKLAATSLLERIDLGDLPSADKPA